MLTSEEVYNAFCRDRCRYLNPPTVDALDACTDCPVSRLSAPPPWYAYPDYIPPPDTPCLLVSIEKSKMHYMIGVYKVFSETKKGFFNPIFFGQARADLSGCLAAYKRTGIFYAKAETQIKTRGGEIVKKREQISQDFDRILAKKIYECRTSLGLSQDQVVAQLQLAGLDMCREVFSRLERGLRPLYPLELLLICNILNIDLSALSIPGRNGQTFSQSAGGKF